jgi:hypothetical protein
MKIDDINKRIIQLFELADKVIRSEHASTHGVRYVSEELFYEFRLSTLSFLKNIYGEKHPYYIDFEKDVNDSKPYYAKQGRGILKAIKQEIDEGWIFNLKGIISAEIFTDFLEMAEYLLNENYKDPAAVVIGSVLEEHLRQLCDKNNIPVTKIKDSKKVPLKADFLNSQLVKADVYNKLDQKSVTSWLDLRNKAAHGKYDEYTKGQVDLMYASVVNFIARNS